MALKVEVYIDGDPEIGPIDLEASLAKLRAMLERVDDAQNSTVTLRLSPIFAARQMNTGPNWSPTGAFTQVWQSQDWIVPATAEDAATDTEEILDRG